MVIPFSKRQRKDCWILLAEVDVIWWSTEERVPHWNAAIWDVPRHFCNLILPFVGVSKTLLYPGSPRPSKKVVAHFWMIKIWFTKKKQSTWWNPTTFNGLLTSRAYLASYFTIQRWVQTHSWTSFIKISKKGMAIHRIWFSELRFMPCPAFFGLATVPRHAVQAHGTFNSTKILGCDGDIFLRMTPVLSNQLSNEKRDPGWLGFFGGLYYPII